MERFVVRGITGRYVTQADAVIFTIDSGQPLTRSEMRFLETCMEVTPNILFIQTKLDSMQEPEWRQIQKRNETLLNTRFHKEGRPPFRVFPVSSHLFVSPRFERNWSGTASCSSRYSGWWMNYGICRRN